MSTGPRGCVVSTLAVLVSTFAALPAQAQSSPGLSRPSLLAGIKFDGPAARPAPALQQPSGAQDHGIGVGVLAGMSRSQLTGGDNIEEFIDTRIGTMLGGWVGGNMNGLIGFTGEFIYIWRKTDIDVDGDGFDDELSYPAFSIPAVFHINFGPEDRRKGLFYVIVGPVFTFNLSQKVKVDGQGESIDVSDEFNGADIGILGGGGFEIFRVGVEVRHNWGLRAITEDGVADIKTRSWEFLVKFRFN
jgi:outer membrane protein with beta-barrel domain